MKKLLKIFGLIITLSLVITLVSCKRENGNQDDFITSVYYNEQNELIVKYNSGKEENLSELDIIIDVELINGELIVSYAIAGERNLGNLTGPKGDAGAKGTDGRTVNFRTTSTAIEWQYEGDSTWNELMSLNLLKGPKGDKGEQGEPGTPGNDGADGKDGVGIDFIEVDEGYLVIYLTNDTYYEFELETVAGLDGKSAYQIYKEQNPSYTKTEKQWMTDLVNGDLATKQKYTVTYYMNSDFNPGHDNYSETYQSITFKVDKGEKIPFINNKREGFLFGGWEYMSYQENANFIWNFDGHVVTSSTTLLPIWIPIYEDIYTVEDLIAVGSSEENLAKNYQLKNDIDLENMEWVPIGNDNKPFLGHFNGNGFTIKNFKVSDIYNNDSVGLFGHIGGKGYQTPDDLVYATNIKDLVIENATIDVVNTIKYSLNVGILAGKMVTGGSISNVKVINSSITASNENEYANSLYVGGLIGRTGNNGYTSRSTIIENIDIEANINVGSSILSYVGGIIGIQDTTTYFINLKYNGTINLDKSGKVYAAFMIGYHAGFSTAVVTYANATSTINVLANDDTIINFVAGNPSIHRTYYFTNIDVIYNIDKTDESVRVYNYLEVIP